MAWFPVYNSSLLWNLSFKFHLHVVCGYGQKPVNFQQCQFQNGFFVIPNLNLVWL